MRNTVAVAPSAPARRVSGHGARSLQEHERWAQLDERRSCPAHRWSSSRGDLARGRPALAGNGVRRPQLGRWEGTAGRSIAGRCTRPRTAGRPGAPSTSDGQPVAISPTASPSTQQPVDCGVTSRLLRSADGGRSWQPADSGLPSTYLWALAFDPTTPRDRVRRDGPAWDLREQRRRRAVARGARLSDVPGRDCDRRRSAPPADGLRRNRPRSDQEPRRRPQLAHAERDDRRHGRDRWYMQVTALLVDPHDSRTVYATTAAPVSSRAPTAAAGGARRTPASSHNAAGRMRSRSIRRPRGRSTPPTPRAGRSRASTAPHTGR